MPKPYYCQSCALMDAGTATVKGKPNAGPHIESAFSVFGAQFM